MDPSTFIVNIIRKAVHVLVKRVHEDPDLVIEDDDTTNSLCSAIEAILLNGQEEVRYKRMMTFIGIGPTRQPYECCFWDYLKHYLPKQTCEMIMNSRIQEKRTPIGCCRVWVRVALNEATICNYLESMRFDSERTNRFYKSTALIRDADRMEATLGLLRMVSSECTFNLDCVGWELNSWNMSTALSLANVHYVVPTVTPLRPHSNTSAGLPYRQTSTEYIRPPSLSSPDSMNEETTEDSNNVTTTPVPQDVPAPLPTPVEEKGDEEKTLTNCENLSPEPTDKINEDSDHCNDFVPSTSSSCGDTMKTPEEENPAAAERVHDLNVPEPSSSNFTTVPLFDHSLTSSNASHPRTIDSASNHCLSAMQVADELPASPVCEPPMISVASMSPEAIVAEAMRRGLLRSPPEMPLCNAYLETLIHAVEAHRRVEREEQLESMLERPRDFFRNSPQLSTDNTSNSSWDKNVGNSSSTQSASDLVPNSTSPPEMLYPDTDGQLSEEDEFAIFPRRRTHLENSDDYTASLMASTSAPNLARVTSNRTAQSEVEKLDFASRHTVGEASSLSTSWDRSSRNDPTRSNTVVINPRIIATPPSEGILERITSAGRRGSGSSLINRISSGFWQSTARLRSGTMNPSAKHESDDEWEIIGDEFIATKNARCKRLLDIYPGALRVPDPQHDFSDTNCARCRGHIIGRLRKLDYYDGRWYCSSCHENAISIIPRKVIHNWDFSQHPVSNETKVILTRLFLQPNIDVMKSNPSLYSLCPELREVTRVRRQLAFLWQYVVDCPSGVARDMNRMLIPRERLIGTIPEIHLYSLEDLNLVYHGGALLKLVHHVLKRGLTHVWSCSECQTSRPHFCDRCGERIPLYELDIYYKCLTATCDAVVHKRCYAQRPDDFFCLVCTRKKENNVPLHETYDAVFVDNT